jgi:uncharacterized protein (TIGR03437 family)
MRSRFSSICLALVLPFTAAAQSVLTANYDNARTNSNLAETILTPGNVGPASFGKLFALSVDGQIYTQPLFMPALPVGGAAHNVVFVATMHNSIYAFDGDGPATPLWTVNLGPSIPASTFDLPGEPYADVENEIGILGTPVIDASTRTLYAVAGTLESAGNGNSAVLYRLHAVDVTTGAERFGAPVEIGGAVTGVGDNSINGLVVFDPAQHIQRPGLALANGVVYVSFGSHSDAAPYHGWLFAYSAANVQNQVAVYNPTPNGSGGALWQSGRAPAIDSAGNIYVVSGNGDTDGVTSFSDSMLKLNPRSLALTDWFAPSNVQTLNGSDDDLGAMGPMLIPNTGFVVTGGKQGIVYLLDQTKLGNLNSTDTQIPQKFQPVNFGVFNAALWPRSGGATLYLHGSNSPVQSWIFNGSAFLAQPASQSIGSFAVPFQGMAISANGSRRSTGILWVVTADSYPLPSTGTIRAYDADDLTSALWDSGMNPADALGEFIKFANPTVANGKVYVPTGSKQLLIYGLAAGNNPAPAITAVTNAASYAAGPVAPGELLAIFGENLGPANLVQGQWSLENILAEQAAGVEVTFNGMPAPILYASSDTIATIAPFALNASGQVAIQVGVNGVMSPVQNLPVAATAPGIFSLDSSGSGPGVILNSDYSVNSAANPAPAGSVVMVYATGGGMTAGQNTTGHAASAAASLSAPVTATAGGAPATVLYAGSAPEEANGVVQVNLQLPDGVTGIVPVVLSIGGVSSQATVTVAIR